ncbi:hypothetical protein NUW54_g14270 [Trametes sanguinea]|uniref:Uncharacterized protein n=1 Tax=Trametes sanguinea TaxID=158606 RepID=A0ACC1MFI0_9APHY|nr:hypothetical protein NUW54_g14270 [Trametes sanguinea]
MAASSGWSVLALEDEVCEMEKQRPLDRARALWSYVIHEYLGAVLMAIVLHTSADRGPIEVGRCHDLIMEIYGRPAVPLQSTVLSSVRSQPLALASVSLCPPATLLRAWASFVVLAVVSYPLPRPIRSPSCPRHSVQPALDDPLTYASASRHPRRLYTYLVPTPFEPYTPSPCLSPTTPPSPSKANHAPEIPSTSSPSKPCSFACLPRHSSSSRAPRTRPD